MDAVFTPEELAERYHTTPEAVRMWRYRGNGPKFFRTGKRVFYREAAVLEWEQQRQDDEAKSA